jgi:hypothetical protein
MLYFPIGYGASWIISMKNYEPARSYKKPRFDPFLKIEKWFKDLANSYHNRKTFLPINAGEPYGDKSPLYKPKYFWD